MHIVDNEAVGWPCVGDTVTAQQLVGGAEAMWVQLSLYDVCA